MTKNNEQIIKEKDLDTRCPYHCNEKYGQCNNPSPDNKYLYCVDYKDCIYKLYARKEQECEELKKANDSILTTLNVIAKGNIKLRQTLAEIEKLSIQGNVYCIDYNVNDCDKCIKQSDCKTKLFKQILQKINEVEDEKI